MHAATVTDVAALIVAAGNRDFVHIRNNHDTESIWVKYDGSATALTSTNGLPIVAGGLLLLENAGARNIHRNPIYAIADTGKSVNIRIQGAAEP